MIDEGATPTGAPHTSESAAREPGAVTEQLKAASQDVAREAQAAGQKLRQEASGLAGTIRQGLSEQAVRQKNGIADRLSAVAERAQRTAGDLRQDEAWLGNLLGRGANELAGIADELRRQDVADLMGSVEVFARRQPALFMGAAVAMGFALTRMVGAGAAASGHDDDRYQQNHRAGYGDDDYPRTATSGYEPRPDVAQSTPAAAMTGSNI